jgi:hypothetical protein
MTATATATAATATTAQNVGLFLVRYNVSTGLAGAPTLTLALTVNTVDRTMNGAARLTQATNPPLDRRMNVQGTYASLPLPPNPAIVANLVGHPVVQWPHGGGIGPVILPDLNLHMQLDSDFQRGVASYRYLAPNGQWIDVNDVPVRKE